MEQIKSVKAIRVAKIGYVFMSALLCILGVFLLVGAQPLIENIKVISGTMMIIFGIVKLIGYFSKDLYRLAFQYDLAFGILLIGLGVVMFFKTQDTVNFICTTLGISILTDGLFKIQISIDSKIFGIKLWWLIFILACLTCIVGIRLVAQSSSDTQFILSLIGVSLITEGVLSMSTVLTAVKIIQHQKPDNIDFY